MMGSVLETLLLARCSMNPAESYQTKRAPKDKNGNDIPIHDWNLSTLIDVAVEVAATSSTNCGLMSDGERVRSAGANTIGISTPLRIC